MKLKTLVAAMAIVLGAPAFAAIAPFTTGNPTVAPGSVPTAMTTPPSP